MCGIFGYTFKKGAMSEGRRALLGMALGNENDNRGGHSWGVLKLDDGINVQKGLGCMGDNAYALLGTEFMYGHTRWATHGEKTVANAHPFEIGNIVGAHNGVLSNHAELNMKYQRKYAVDSMHLFAHLRDGLPFSDIEGYGSIQWVDKDDTSRMYLSRLRNGQLSVRGIGNSATDTRGVVWSSDENHLLAALATAGIKEHFGFEVTEGSVYLLEDGAIYITEDELHLKAPRQLQSKKTKKVKVVNSHGLLASDDGPEEEDDYPLLFGGGMTADETRDWAKMFMNQK